MILGIVVSRRSHRPQGMVLIETTTTKIRIVGCAFSACHFPSLWPQVDRVKLGFAKQSYRRIVCTGICVCQVFQQVVQASFQGMILISCLYSDVVKGDVRTSSDQSRHMSPFVLSIASASERAAGVLRKP